jgi:hypothetical protein
MTKRASSMSRQRYAPKAKSCHAVKRDSSLRNLTPFQIRSAKPQSVQKRSADCAVHVQPVGAFVSCNCGTRSGPDYAIDYPMKIAELAKAPLHRSDGRTGIAIPRTTIVRVVVGVTAVVGVRIIARAAWPKPRRWG